MPHPALLLLTAAMAARARGQPMVDAVIQLDAAAAVPTAQTAADFAVNHSGPVFFAIATAAIRVNACLDACKDAKCIRFDQYSGKCHATDSECSRLGDGSVMNTRMTLSTRDRSRLCHPDDHAAMINGRDNDRPATFSYAPCMPLHCQQTLGQFTIPLPGLEHSHIRAYSIANTSFANDVLAFKGTRVMPCKACMLRDWARSQTVADMRTLCTEIKTYNNATRLLWQLGYSVSSNTMSRVSMLLDRHPNAKRLLALMSRIKARDLCNAYATAIAA